MNTPEKQLEKLTLQMLEEGDPFRAARDKGEISDMECIERLDVIQFKYLPALEELRKKCAE